MLFSIYVNDFSDGITTDSRFFTDDLSIVSVVDKMNLSVTNLNRDLSKINASANQSKMSFNTNPNI